MFFEYVDITTILGEKSFLGYEDLSKWIKK